ncbi:MAG: Crp/Fnr family transcriptional regulator [Paracoccaceae bacterium]|nr:Crp/Fnr family transcriptional regulator [Paracoccaceae bacterium]
MIDEKLKTIAGESLLLRNLPADVVDLIAAKSTTRTYRRGETVFVQGEAASAIYVVLSGWIKLYRVTPNGAEAVVNVFTKGQSFGEAAALQNGNYPVSAEATTEANLMRIPTQALFAMVRENPDIALAMLASTFHHLHSLISQVEQLKAHTGAQRVAEFLLELCPVEEGACTVTLPYDKVLIAGRLGLKPESLSRVFSRLRNYGVTIRRNHALISEVKTLRAYANEDGPETLSVAL